MRVDGNDDQINEKYDQSLLDVIDPDINAIGNDNVINHDLHVNFNEHDPSILSDIDPDIHNNNYSDSHYYKENSFNNVFKQSKDQGWGQVQYLYLVLVLKYIFIST